MEHFKYNPSDVPDKLPLDEHLRLLDQWKREDIDEKYPGLSIQEVYQRLGKEKFEAIYGPLHEFIDQALLAARPGRSQTRIEYIAKHPHRFKTSSDGSFSEKPTVKNQMIDYNDALEGIASRERIIQDQLKEIESLNFWNILDRKNKEKFLAIIQREKKAYEKMKERALKWLEMHKVRIPQKGFTSQEIDMADNEPESK